MNRTLTLVLTVTLLLSACNNNKKETAEKASPVTVLTVPVKREAVFNDLKLSGNIEGTKTVRLGFLVAGRVNFIAADEGDRIRKGELISSLDPSAYEIAMELAEIQVNQTQDEYNRLNGMHKSNSITESDFSKITFGLQQAKAQLRLHSKNLADTRLYAPFDGILLKKLCETGEITASGMPLFVLSDIRTVRVNAFIPETELHMVSEGQKAVVEISAAGRSFEGKVTGIGSLADPAARSFQIKIDVPNPDLLIRPGMLAELTITATRSREILEIPAEALLHDFNGQSYVFVADSVSGLAYRRNIATGKLFGDKLEISSGLTENELVICGGQQKIVDQEPVAIRK